MDGEEVHRHAFLAPSVLTAVSYLMTLEFDISTGGADYLDELEQFTIDRS